MFAHSANTAVDNERDCLDALEIQVQTPIWRRSVPVRLHSLNRFLPQATAKSWLLPSEGLLASPPSYCPSFQPPTPNSPSYLRVLGALHSGARGKGNLPRKRQFNVRPAGTWCWPWASAFLLLSLPSASPPPGQDCVSAQYPVTGAVSHLTTPDTDFPKAVACHLCTVFPSVWPELYHLAGSHS